jgi:hypothetical protein
MTQKEKLNEAMKVAMRVKSIAKSIEFDARDYDESWPLHHVRDLNNLADNFLKLFK